MNAATVDSTALTERELVQFVYREASLLDQARYAEWLELFADDGMYWMPLSPGQTDAKLHTSLMHEDKLLLGIRIERLAGARTYSQQPPSRCHHLLQQPEVLSRDDEAGQYQLRTSFHYIETRKDDQFLLAGWATHDLVRVQGALRIALKRVDLLNCDAAFGNICLFP
ncbi:aromatic-ring-hydroxylating dioxygenase subunit beta [Ottowia sp.]|uniref:aromatic-ring-hydroxylating dioxygenase subunit beta n=1 Tax=Ottowia sp. TaxID=1898956 RepID=UPI002CB011E2|nr:aromatic-ring-hydroxylating dioxygenase subunit beta [Ottowia sp.]HOB65664.1 aromatic-ring-hydroxylating dioxygenase subunit beta [Ottowia sp.]HPZ57441.1 aromatic-ring-hydroxylating dioxygenase subunit beta [Ottowia sp.]HQD46942.1 aromatic-ring-hydroxylating dioxygenase subunit beta [Ottowia sp.]